MSTETPRGGCRSRSTPAAVCFNTDCAMRRARAPAAPIESRALQRSSAEPCRLCTPRGRAPGSGLHRKGGSHQEQWSCLSVTAPAPAALHSPALMGEIADPARHQLAFVAGLHRSGTTLVAQMLAEHPDVSGLTDT